MSLSLADTYFVKALDNYKYEMENSIEALNYALGYDPNHAPSNCLMGRVYMEYIKDYDKAEEYFGYAIASDPKYPDTYELFAEVLIWKGEIRHAQKLINFGMKLPGVDKAILHGRRAKIYEIQMRHDLALKEFEIALTHSYSSTYTYYFEAEVARIKKKRKVLKAKKKKKKKSKVG